MVQLLFRERTNCADLIARLESQGTELPVHTLQVHTADGLSLDFFAFGLALALTVLLILGTHETSLFNLGMLLLLAALKGHRVEQCLLVLTLLQLSECLG